MSPVSDEGQAIPRIAADWTPSGRALSPQEGFLLSRVDGQTPWAALRQIAGLPPEEVDRCLQRWLDEGVIEVVDSRSITPDGRDGGSAVPAAAPGPAPAAPADEAELEKLLEPDVDLPEVFQRRILEFEATLAHRNYYDVLGVERSADGRQIKRAYFVLSKEFHPDRYYRRELGGFRTRLEDIFKKVVEAYELLSDPNTRAEIDRSLPAEPEPVPQPEPEPEPEATTGAPEPLTPQQRRRQTLERLRRRFRIPDGVLAERKANAERLYEGAMLACKQGQWIEAATGVKLAIAFDPWNDEYKVGFATVQAEVHKIRAVELLERADASWDDSSRHEAMRLYEEALAFRPADATTNARAARLAMELEDYDAAREYAEVACEVEPEVASHRVTLARVLRRQGMPDRAREAYDEAVRLAPKDDDVKAERKDFLEKSKRRRGRKR